MEANRMDNAIQNAKNYIANHPAQISPFELQRILSFFENTLKENITAFEEKLSHYKNIYMPSFDQLKAGLETLDTLSHDIQTLSQTLQTLDSINGIDKLDLSEELLFLDSFIRVDTTILANQLTKLQKETEQTTTRYTLQKNYLLYKESYPLQYSSSDMLTRSSETIAGHYLTITNGNLSAAKNILMSILEQGYIISGEPFLQTDRAAEIIAAIALLSPKLIPSWDHQAEKSTLPHQKDKSPLCQGRGEEESLKPIIPEKTTKETGPQLNENKNENLDPKPSWELVNENTINSLDPSTTEPNLETNEISSPAENSISKETHTVNQPAIREITFEEYNQKGYLHSNLKKEKLRLTKRLLEIQKEFKNDISSATKEQMTIFTQTKTAIEDVQKRLDDAEAEMNQLNQDIKNGRLIRVAMKTPNTASNSNNP